MNKELQNSLTIKLNKEIYSKDAVMETSYKFTNNFYFEIESLGESYLIKMKPKIKLTNTKNIKDIFLNELLDQQLRVNLRKKNQKVKEMIIKKAFFPFHDSKEDING